MDDSCEAAIMLLLVVGVVNGLINSWLFCFIRELLAEGYAYTVIPPYVRDMFSRLPTDGRKHCALITDSSAYGHVVPFWFINCWESVDL
jgi:hypothetical protein